MSIWVGGVVCLLVDAVEARTPDEKGESSR